MQIIDLVPDLRPTILAARQLQDARNSLARFFPVVNVAAVTYRLGRKTRNDQTVAIRAFDAPAIPILKQGIVEVRGDLPAVTPLVPFTEVDLNQELILAQQLAGQQVDWQPAVTSGAGQVAATVDNTMEAMRGQLLSTGGIALVAEDGTTHTVDFGIPGGQIITAGAPLDPTNGAAVWAAYAAAHQVYKNVAGDKAGVALTTDAVYIKLVAATQQMFPSAPVGIDQVAAYAVNRGLPVPVTYDRQMKDAAGVRTRFFAEGTLVFLPSNDDPIGRTELGITQEAVQQVQRVQLNGRPALSAAEVPGLTIVTLGRDNPVQRAVKGAAVGMPVLGDTDAIVIWKGLV
ncbi:major capsid protein [Pimelobacter simplex]|uniref:major capsid protein n=1 Tax=Nocardioides simplex TaxID=2045 RepID=UPI0021501047|nr:major capsid protein [Pimelobacter simplex]UUW88395.1 major capsid protein [Pimelobacter simplex]UUW97899.1 major capsid protein [Pimelobacter simplex]